jgi:hypothetical protein
LAIVANPAARKSSASVAQRTGPSTSGRRAPNSRTATTPAEREAAVRRERVADRLAATLRRGDVGDDRSAARQHHALPHAGDEGQDDQQRNGILCEIRGTDGGEHERAADEQHAAPAHVADASD